MKLTADLHLHSRYSNATSSAMNLPTMASWARRKGIDLLGTADFTHPVWRKALHDQLREEPEGIYTLNGMRFMITGELSLVWRHDGRGRRMHLVLLVPNLDEAERISAELGKRGNINADGRPILGLAAGDCLDLVWEQSPDTVVIPAHVWTPWYSVFGSKSGFDAMEDCFGSYADRIFAIETGLSSDPPMNRRVSALDRFTLVSNSDAHSPAKLAREATLFDLEDVSFASIAEALRTKQGYEGTLEFYPEEGKYHYDGHRKCGVSMHPAESMKHENRCPVCGKPMTLGVLHRVEELADRKEPKLDAPYRSLVPLAELIAHVLGKGVNTKTVTTAYDSMLERYGTELDILLEHPIDDMAAETPDGVLEAITNMRAGNVELIPGYDGEFGKVVLTRSE